MSTGVQAKELREVSASEILKQIENGEDIFLENVRITGKLDLSKIDLKTVPNARSARDIEYYGLEKELKECRAKCIISSWCKFNLRKG